VNAQRSIFKEEIAMSEFTVYSVPGSPFNRAVLELSGRHLEARGGNGESGLI
jgi:hypothetical protein